MSTYDYDGEWPAEQYHAMEFQASDDTEWKKEPSPRIKVMIGNTALFLTRGNTKVYLNDRNPSLHHIYITRGEDPPQYLYRDTLGEERFDKLLDALASASMDFVDTHEPDQMGVDVFVENSMRNFEREWVEASEEWNG